MSFIIIIIRKYDDSDSFIFLFKGEHGASFSSSVETIMQSFANIYSLLMSASYYVPVTHLLMLSSHTPTFISFWFVEPICAFYGLILLFPIFNFSCHSFYNIMTVVGVQLWGNDNIFTAKETNKLLICKG